MKTTPTFQWSDANAKPAQDTREGTAKRLRAYRNKPGFVISRTALGRYFVRRDGQTWGAIIRTK